MGEQEATMITIVNVGYSSTNYYVLGQNTKRLLVDVGMPGTLPKLLANLKRKDIRLSDIGYLLVTHYHPDHAGVAQNVKVAGIRLIVLEPQRAAIAQLKTLINPSMPYTDITLHDNLQLTLVESRAFLHRIGIAGTIIATPGHSADSITLVLDDGSAFTGDLPPTMMAGTENHAAISSSWQLIRSLHATTIYPGHGPTRTLDSLTPES